MSNVNGAIYPLDLTATLPNNLIQNETHNFANAVDYIFVPDGGPFYQDSLIIKDINGNLLHPIIDFKLMYQYEDASVASGMNVVQVIWVLNTNITGVVLSYQVVGGQYGNTVAGILQELQKSGPIKNTVDWNTGVYNKPDQFPPAPHYQTADTFTDWNVVYTQLDGIRQAIIAGDAPSWASVYRYLDLKINNFSGTMNGSIGSAISTALGNVYTRDEINSKFVSSDTLNSGLNSTLAQAVQQANSYTDSKTNGVLQQSESYTDNKANNTLQQANAYTDSKITTAINGIPQVDLSNYNTKAQDAALYVTQSQLGNYYTGSQVDSKISSAVASVSSGGSVDLSNYYTKSQVDSKIASVNTGGGGTTNNYNTPPLTLELTVILVANDYSSGDTTTTPRPAGTQYPAVGESSTNASAAFNITKFAKSATNGTILLTSINGITIPKGVAGSAVLDSAGRYRIYWNTAGHLTWIDTANGGYSYFPPMTFKYTAVDVNSGISDWAWVTFPEYIPPSTTPSTDSGGGDGGADGAAG